MRLLANLEGVNLWPLALVLFVAACVYLLPSVVAASTRHRYTAVIAVVNVFLGWTIVGWLIAFVWALINPVSRPQAPTPRQPA